MKSVSSNKKFQDEAENDCTKGDGDDVESNEDFVSVDFSCGSMVWGKFSGWFKFV